MQFKNRNLLFAFLLVILFIGCKKINDNTIDPILTQNLEDALSADPSLSKFNDFVKRTAADVLLQSAKTFTVWAPTNDALASLDPAIISDTAKLRAFVLNHIAYQTYFARDVQASVRVPMVNGKYNNFFASKIEDANVLTADKFVSNGVLHTIDKPLLVLPNLWDYINSTASAFIQNGFLSALNFTVFDSTRATIDSISSLTGRPVYRPGTGLVAKNTFLERTYDVRREDKQYTYFVIANTGFTPAADALKPYYKASTTAITDSLDKWNISKDLIVDTLYPTAASLPATITSKFGVSMPVNKGLIIDARKVSNGIVYTMSSLTTTLTARFPEIRVEGENPSGFQSDKTSNTNFVRIRRDRPDTTKNYTDLMVTGHGVTGYYSFYRLNEMPTMKYNIYVRATNDFTVNPVYESIVPVYFTPPSNFATLPLTSIQLPTNTTQLSFSAPFGYLGGSPTGPPIVSGFSEIFLGTFTSNLFGTIDIRLVSGGLPSTATPPVPAVLGSSGAGPIVLDYFRLVPVP